GVVAVVTETCGAKSHTAILARGLGMPLVTGIENLVGRVRDGAPIAVDAGAGVVLVDPSPAEEETLRQIRAAGSPEMLSSSRLMRMPSATKDGTPVSVLLNISDPLEAESVAQSGIGGVGLFRTEFLYMDRLDWLTEDES